MPWPVRIATPARMTVNDAENNSLILLISSPFNHNCGARILDSFATHLGLRVVVCDR
jgi:hypothetical protein